MIKLQYKLPPMEHQKEAMLKAWPHSQFAFFMEMGTGKTYSTINLASARFINDQINAMIVICPTPAKLVWEHELEKFSPVPYDVFVMESGKNADAVKYIKKSYDEPTLKVMVFGIESFSQGKAYEIAEMFCKNHETKAVVDESTAIKNPKAARTKRVIEVGGLCDFRLILTGSPITQGIEDLYGQFKFLNEWIIGCKSFFQFRNKFCMMGGFENRKVIGYQNTHKLLEQVSRYIYTVKLEDCVDMPEKSHRMLYVDPTRDQAKAMQSLKDLFEAEVGGDLLTTSTVLERLTRYQQICGGNFPFNEEDGGYDTKPIPGRNPKLAALVEDIELSLSGGQKALVWARFRPEIDAIVAVLREQYGHDAVVEFHGGIDYSSRKENVRRFQDDDNVRFFVSSPAVGGKALTLTAAHHSYYFSNDFSYENRIQSEFRTWRNGQRNHCSYTDIIMNVSYDKMIAEAIKTKADLAQYVDERIEHYQSVPK